MRHRVTVVRRGKEVTASLPPIPSQPSSQIAQVLKFARQDIEAILRGLGRREHYAEFMESIDELLVHMQGLQGRIEKRSGVFRPEVEQPESPEDEQALQTASA
jgi:hypothetical protein